MTRRRSAISDEHNEVCRHAANALDRLADEDQDTAGHLTNRAVAWRAQARKLREFIVEECTQRDDGKRPPVRESCEYCPADGGGCSVCRQGTMYEFVFVEG